SAKPSRVGWNAGSTAAPASSLAAAAAAESVPASIDDSRTAARVPATSLPFSQSPDSPGAHAVLSAPQALISAAANAKSATCRGRQGRRELGVWIGAVGLVVRDGMSGCWRARGDRRKEGSLRENRNVE